ncbi:MAG: anaerobic ribonucleoside-triphosphate reductase activating protein [Lactobacillales bacterium]|jgi:anaerobic ribonucleoside-triphosphate reductase activating protein|nr:anaerobic ribonucleoside-triphosphate reductase activating protein [Lactobacillales bacterium]
MPVTAGLVPFTTIDFPGHLAAAIFFKGCPLRCPFCHNPDLQNFSEINCISWDEVISFLKQRTRQLDGVALSGGEPLAQPDIIPVVQSIKAMGYKVGIHTAGVYPDILKKLIPLIDWVGLDIKAPWQKYDVLAGRKNTVPLVQKSLRDLSDSGRAFEVRTTCDPRYLTVDDIYAIAAEIKSCGVTTYALQKYRTFPGDQNPPEDSAINIFFENEPLIQKLKSDFPTLILRD